MKLKSSSVLIVAAHPDDEVLGCGGTIKKLTKSGNKVNIIFISDGVSSRKMSKKNYLVDLKQRKESCIKACKILGAKRPIFYDLPDNALDTVPILKIVKLIGLNIKKFKPKLILTHCADDLNIDHHITNKAVVTACRPLKNNSVKTLLFFEIASSTEWQIVNKRKSFSPNWFENIDSELKLKIKALKAYKKELRKWPHPRSSKGVEVLAQWRGSSSGFKAAEAFILGRNLK